MLRIESKAHCQDGLIIIQSQKVYLGDTLICLLPTRSAWMHTIFSTPEEMSHMRSLGRKHFIDHLNEIVSDSLLKKLLNDSELKRFLERVY